MKRPRPILEKDEKDALLDQMLAERGLSEDQRRILEKAVAVVSTFTKASMAPDVPGIELVSRDRLKAKLLSNPDKIEDALRVRLGLPRINSAVRRSDETNELVLAIRSGEFLDALVDSFLSFDYYYR